MPYLDGTGPSGQGPLTGKGMGGCGGRCPSGMRGKFARRAGWLGCRFGYGFNYQSSIPADAANTKSYIKNLKVEIKEAEKYLKDLENEK
mgnify:CR=1 FL=1